MRTDDLDFDLPPELIAQTPAPQRTDSRLLRYMRGDRSISHHTFWDVPTFLRKGDLLVFNDARVIPARFTLHKSTGGRVEGLFIEETGPGNWRVLLKNLGRATDVPLHFADEPQLRVRVMENLGEGEYRINVGPPETGVRDTVGDDSYSLPRYSGGGLGRGPDLQETQEAKPQPQISSGASEEKDEKEDEKGDARIFKYVRPLFHPPPFAQDQPPPHPSPGVPEEGEREVAKAQREPEPAALVLERVGRMPLPPYIKREKDHDDRDEMDRDRYQTVFAKSPGAVAAPTAALHYSPQLLELLDAIGVERTFVTLHVGLGTFKPVTADVLEDHRMHEERYSISEEAAGALNRAKRDGRRIIAVGTTAARVLESQPESEAFVAKSGVTGIFIYPPYRWKHVAAMITNFHLPRSTLIALVAAMIGLDEQRRVYRAAIENRYRFFSYGDAMLIE
ncbi:MAG TPA: tRNA preQ1(34) S-adenosylmethionine ribosyltransferase-isomerase QueA [Humisphaera sp.]|nr:tRNA preQ1(34) S-adenosylmethionine ribosyltransferase-isomerase QueA [Humisphaera sp.]